MSRHCLLLNGDGRPVSYFPLSLIDWRTAIRLRLGDRVRTIKEYDDWEVHSPSISVRVPSILMLKRYHRRRNLIRFSRTTIYLRDDHTCQYCGKLFEKRELTLDHVVPRSKGGRIGWDNVVTACKACNTAKGSSLQRPMREPGRPSLRELLVCYRPHLQDLQDQAWLNYIIEAA